MMAQASSPGESSRAYRRSKSLTINALREDSFGGAINASGLAEVDESSFHVSEYRRSRHRARRAAVRPWDESSFIRPGVGYSIQLVGSLVAMAGLLMSHETTDDLSQRMAATTSIAPELLSNRADASGTDIGGENPADQRGILAVEYHHPVLFETQVEITPGNLAKWEPEIFLDERHFRDEDA